MITIATDCSGIEAPIEALKQLKISHKHIWSCEIDKDAIKSIKANYSPGIIFEDITTRKLNSSFKNLDLYVCGFPCQPFSLAGKKLGSKDSRASIMDYCIDTIKYIKPKCFILENVKNFKFMEDGKNYRYLMVELKKLNYEIYDDIYNTCDYGIPQNRERIYMIGIRRDIIIKRFDKPKKIPMKNIKNYLLDEKIYDIKPFPTCLKIMDKFDLHDKDVIVACSGFGNYMKDKVPTITCHKYFYLTKYKRYLTSKELLILQGFRKGFKKVISDTAFKKQIGNSMSVNVVKKIIQELLRCIKQT